MSGNISDGGDYIFGRNSVREALKSGSQIDKVFIAAESKDGSIGEIRRLAADRNVIVTEVPRRKIDDICLHMGQDRINHQGVIAAVPAFEYSTLDDVFAYAEKQAKPPFIVVLENIQDPHNLGAIIRSAEAFGAHGVIIGKRRSASLTSAVYKVSSGAAEYIPVVKVTNINQTIEEIKARGVFVAAADMEGAPVESANLTGAMAIVIGGEASGVPRLTKQLADMVVKIEMPGHTQSLNASCAASVVLYEKTRQDREQGGKH
jgi:23S rRNA (guanosine2251-2'-O)-methyltransferase